MSYFLRTEAGVYWPMHFGTTLVNDADRLLSREGMVALAWLSTFEQPDYYWVNKVGGYQRVLQIKADEARIFETQGNTHPQEGAARRSIDFYTDETLETGWIDPQGNFYPVRYGLHKPFLEYVMNMNPNESAGWIHVHKDFWHLNEKSSSFGKGKPSQEQMITLQKIGRDIRDSHTRIKSITFAKAVPDWRARKMELNKRIIRTDTTIYDARELNLQEKQAFYAGLRMINRLQRGKKLYLDQRDNGVDGIPMRGYLNLQKYENRVREQLRL